MSRTLIALASAAALSGPALALDPGDYEAFNRALADRVIVPGYQGHAAAASALATLLVGYCSRAPGDSPGKLTDAFHDAMDAWQRVQPVTFGPVTAEAGPARIEFWPDKRGTGARQLARALRTEDRALLVPGALVGKSVALGDLRALETALFDPGARPAPPGGYRCELALAIARHQTAIARAIADGWTGEAGFRQAVTSAAAGNDVYHDAVDAARDLMRSAVGAIDAAIVLKLEGPLGSDLEHAVPKRAESWRTERSLRDIAANLDTVGAILATPDGLGRLLELAGAGALANGLREELAAVAEAARRFDMPLARAVGDPVGRGDVLRLTERLRAVRVLLAGTVARETGLSAGFNATDGD